MARVYLSEERGAPNQLKVKKIMSMFGLQDEVSG